MSRWRLTLFKRRVPRQAETKSRRLQQQVSQLKRELAVAKEEKKHAAGALNRANDEAAARVRQLDHLAAKVRAMANCTVSAQQVWALLAEVGQ